MPRPPLSKGRLPRGARFPAYSFRRSEEVRDASGRLLRGGHIDRQPTRTQPQLECEERTTRLLASGELTQPAGQDRVRRECQPYTAIEALPPGHFGEHLTPCIQATGPVRGIKRARHR